MENDKGQGIWRLRAAGVALCVIATLLVVAVAAVATGVKDDQGGSTAKEPTPPVTPAGDGKPGTPDELLTCTDPGEPINFEIFSAGSSVAGLPMTGFARRCDDGLPGRVKNADGEYISVRANYVSYVYGDCEIAEGSTGCAPPLEVQTWPACQRSLGDYTFEGEPLPYKDLASLDGAKVVELDFALEKRIEVYTRSSTVVVFASDLDLAMQAVEELVAQPAGQPPAVSAAAVDRAQPERAVKLGAPTPEAVEGNLACGG